MTEIQKRVLHAGLIKIGLDDYMAVLSDDSIDRENEIVGKQFLNKALGDRVVGLVNHENDALSQVCEWIDKKVIFTKTGHSALIARPKWFKSNPKTQILKGMLDEGAKIGISIGAIPKNHDIVKINGQEYKRWIDGEILEASFVAIAANKHAHIMALAKSLNFKKDKSMEVFTMSEEKKPEEGSKPDAEQPEGDGSEGSGEEQTDEAEKKDLHLGGGAQPTGGKKKPKKGQEGATSEPPADNPVEQATGGKSMSANEITKMVDEKVAEKLKQTPLYKMQADEDALTKKTDGEVDKALKKGLLPIIH